MLPVPLFTTPHLSVPSSPRGSTLPCKHSAGAQQQRLQQRQQQQQQQRCTQGVPPTQLQHSRVLPNSTRVSHALPRSPAAMLHRLLGRVGARSSSSSRQSGSAQQRRSEWGRAAAAGRVGVCSSSGRAAAVLWMGRKGDCRPAGRGRAQAAARSGGAGQRTCRRLLLVAKGLRMELCRTGRKAVVSRSSQVWDLRGPGLRLR